MVKSGGRKLNAPNAPAHISHQMRYRQQKTSSANGGSTLDEKEMTTLGEASEVAVQMNIRSKKNQQFVSLNATQALVNNSLDLGSNKAANPTYSTIAAGQAS